MPKSSDADTHRSFTVRLPIAIYLEILELANKEDTNLNRKVTQLIQLGMDKHISLDNMLRQLLVSTPPEEVAA